MNFATFIAIEGPDKVGKQTQSNLLAQHLRNDGWNVKVVEVPFNDGVFYPIIYWMLRSGHAKTKPLTFQVIHFLNKFFWQLFVVPILNWKYDFVILDRWAMSSLVYGRATNISDKILSFMYNRLFKPDATIILLGKSFNSDRKDDCYEADNEFQNSVIRHYRLQCDLCSTPNVSIISCEDTLENVHNCIVHKITNEFDML